MSEKRKKLKVTEDDTMNEDVKNTDIDVSVVVKQWLTAQATVCDVILALIANINELKQNKN